MIWYHIMFKRTDVRSIIKWYCMAQLTGAGLGEGTTFIQQGSLQPHATNLKRGSIWWYNKSERSNLWMNALRKKRCFVSLQNQSFLYSFEGGDRVWWYITLLKEQHKKSTRNKGRVSCNGDWIKQWLHCWRLWWTWRQKLEGSDWLGGAGLYTARAK